MRAEQKSASRRDTWYRSPRGRGLRLVSRQSWLLVASFVLVASAISAPSGAADSIRVRSIKVVRSDAPNMTTLRIETSEAPQWSASAASDSEILLLLSDARLARDRPVKVPRDLALTAVDPEQVSVAGVPTVRLTLGAESGSEHRVRRTAKGLEVDFWRAGSAALAADVSPEASSPATPARNRASRPTSATTSTTAAAAPPVSAPDAGRSPSASSSDPIDARLPHSPDVPAFAIGVGDVLSISVFGIEELSRETPVQPDGQINLPLVGRLTAAGRSLAEAEQAIATILTDKGLATDPQVFVGIDEYKSQGTFVQGAVEQPGLYQIPGGLRLIELLSTAGGLTLRDPAGQRILVIRTLEDGSAQRMQVDAQALLAEGDFSLNVLVLPGDLVLVPEPTTVQVFVSGAVNNPGVIEGKPGEPLTVLHAVTAAGGPTERARVNNITILRRSDSGEERIQVNLKRIQTGRDADVELQSGDSVVVNEWFF